MSTLPTTVRYRTLLVRTWARTNTARNTLLIVANNLVVALGGMCFWFVAAHRFSPALVGVATSGTALVILLSGLSQLGLGYAVIRYADALGPRHTQRLRAMFAVVGGAGLFVGGTSAWLLPFVASDLRQAFAGVPNALWFVGSVAGYALAVQFDSYLLGRRLMGLLLLKGSVVTLSRVALLLISSTPSPGTLIGMTGLSGLLGVLAVSPCVIRRAPPVCNATPVTTRALLRYSWWSYLSGLVGTLPALLLPAVVIVVCGAQQAAAYSMAWSLWGALQLLPAALSWVLFSDPIAPTSKNARLLDVLMGTSLCAFLPVAWAALFLLGPQYLADGWPVVLVLALGFWPYYRTQLLVAQVRRCPAQARLTLAYSLSHLAIVFGSVPLAKGLGISGVALAWASGQLLFWALLRWRVLGQLQPNQRAATGGKP